MTDALTVKDEKDLAKVAAKPRELYEDVPLVFLTAYSLFWLHEWKIRSTIEAIAVLNWRLFPDKFAMVGFSEYHPDAFRTNRSLLQMQPKYRNLLTGAVVKGFGLNDRGKEQARKLIGVLGAPTTKSGAALGDVPKVEAIAKKPQRARSIEPDREISRVKSSKLFQKWKQGEMTDRDLIHVHALLAIFDHTPAVVRLRAMKNLDDAARKTDDLEAQQFLAEVRNTFPQALRN